MRSIARTLYQSALPFVVRKTEDNAEQMHAHGMRVLRFIEQHPSLLAATRALCTVRDERLTQVIRAMRFPTPLGLSAGFDKNAEALHALAALGFGFLSYGSVTRERQQGNESLDPANGSRIIRIPTEGGFLNSLGFNNDGANAILGRLVFKKQPVAIPVGLNVGKSRSTPYTVEALLADQLGTIEKLYSYCDFIEWNPSSPNTPGLSRQLDHGFLRELIAGLSEGIHRIMLDLCEPRKPLIIKGSPDLSLSDIANILSVCERYIDGYACVNTTLSRDGLPHDMSHLPGGRSGKRLFTVACEQVSFIRRHMGRSFFIIGGGGVASAHDAFKLLTLGANLVTRFSSFPYQGPFSQYEMTRDLLAIMKMRDLTHIGQTRESWNV